MNRQQGCSLGEGGSFGFGESIEQQSVFYVKNGGREKKKPLGFSRLEARNVHRIICYTFPVTWRRAGRRRRRVNEWVSVSNKGPRS